MKKKLIFLTFVLLFAIASARLTINWMLDDKELMAATSLLFTVLLGSFFVQEVSGLQKEASDKVKK